MDKRLEAAFDLVKYQETLRNQRDLLEEWAQERLRYAYNGGLFNINPELMNMIKLFLDNKRNSVILFDLNNIPIEITNLQSFLDVLLEIYFEVTNQYYVEYQQLRAKRTTMDLVSKCNEES